MTEPETAGPPSAEAQTFRTPPSVAVAGHLERVGAPDTDAMKWVGYHISKAYPRRNALGIGLDLIAMYSQSSTVLAGMFAIDHEALPSHWKANPEIARTVISICCELEAGLLRAQQIDEAHDGGDPYLDQRLSEVERFVGELQEK